MKNKLIKITTIIITALIIGLYFTFPPAVNHAELTSTQTTITQVDGQ